MTRRWMLLVAVLATAAWSGSALALFHDYFPSGADGNFDVYARDQAPSAQEGYATADSGACRLAKGRDHFYFVDFRTEYSDGPDRLRENTTGDLYDGNLLGNTTAIRHPGANAYGPSPAWYLGKKIVSAYLYIRGYGPSGSGGSQPCNAALPAGTYLQEPVQLLGFRCDNVGTFNDRGWWLDTRVENPAGTPNPTYNQWIQRGGNEVNQTGCCAGYSSVSVLLGEMAPPAWRMGPWSTATGYTTAGDIGNMTPFPVPGSSPAVTVTPAYWKVSSKDPTNPSAVLQAGTAPFDADANGVGGFSGTDDQNFGVSWLIRRSTAHLINTVSMTRANCAGGGGKTNPRAIGTSAGSIGWYAMAIDRTIIQALAAASDAEGGASDAAGGAKGIVFSALDPVTGLANTYTTGSENYSWWTRDQGSGSNGDFGAYLDLKATYVGDANNDGYVNVGDLQSLVAAWGSTGNPTTGAAVSGSYNVGIDCNLDGYINVGDLQALVGSWGLAAPNEP